MRVIAGSCKGRNLKTAPGLHTRPTSDMLKGMLFNILAWRCQDATVVDLCAGSGALGIEALSRGARRAFFFEENPAALAALRSNLALCKLTERADVLQGDLLRRLPTWHPQEKIQLVFFDPPYQSGLYEPVLKIMDNAEWLDEEAILVVEHHKKERIPAQLERLNCYRQTGHGSSMLSFYSAEREN